MKKTLLIISIAAFPTVAADYLIKLSPQPIKVIGNEIVDPNQPVKEEGTNGVCGNSNGLTLPSLPATNLCQSEYGNTNVIENNGLFTWSCNGSEDSPTHNAGSSVNCSANKQESLLVCSVLFYNMTGYAYGSAALAQIEFNLKNNSKFNFGTLLSFDNISGNFSNATVNASSKYASGANLFYPVYAIKGYEVTGNGYTQDYNEYWLSYENRNSAFRVSFNEGQDLASVTYADKSHYNRYATNPDNPNYNIQTSDCSGNIIKTYTIQGFISPADRQTGTFVFD